VVFGSGASLKLVLLDDGIGSCESTSVCPFGRPWLLLSAGKQDYEGLERLLRQGTEFDLDLEKGGLATSAVTV
jgi:hypothetical protein